MAEGVVNPSVVEATCVFCGPSLVHTDTGRCQKCGRATRAPGTTASELRNGVASSPAPSGVPLKTEAFKLPNSTRTRTWLQQARTLRDSFLAMAEKAEAQAKVVQEEAARYRKAASVFGQLLEQVDVESGTATTVRTGKQPGEWSKYGAACVECGRNDVPHIARGYCKKCYDRVRPAKKAVA